MILDKDMIISKLMTYNWLMQDQHNRLMQDWFKEITQNQTAINKIMIKLLESNPDITIEDEDE